GLAQMDGVQMRVGKVVFARARPAEIFEDAGDVRKIERAERDVVVAKLALRKLHERARVRHVRGVAIPELVEQSHPRRIARMRSISRWISGPNRRASNRSAWARIRVGSGCSLSTAAMPSSSEATVGSGKNTP